ncbi:MAG: thioredoxin family protein [Bacilli bacterium]|nr:thioredoxin family protein [Bacilli bacterium]
MRLVKIGAIWCSGCLIMNNVIAKTLKNYSIDYQEYDLDMDEEEASSYHPGDKLPVFVVMNGEEEVTRFVGEYSYDEFVSKLKDVGVIDEKNS